MKKIILIIFTLVYSIAYAQTQQGFNYQAIVHNSSGESIANKKVGVKVTLEDASHVALYVETHTPDTNPQGAFSIIIGNGNRLSNELFENIAWSKGEISLKLEVDAEGGTNYTQIGNPTKLQAVPYALYAENTKEIVSPTNAIDDEPIFVVKNKSGQIVFAVYQTGVRVYVEDSPIVKGVRGGFAVGGLSQTKEGNSSEFFRITSDSARIYIDNTNTKGVRGGFAVGGRSQTKGTNEEYLRITPDSARIYFDNTSTKGARGGFAVGGRSQTKGVSTDFLKITPDSTRIYIDDSAQPNVTKGGFAVGGTSNQLKGGKLNFFNIETNNSGIINPSQAKILWYPLKNAFLTGQVLVQSPDSVGTNSMSSGYESKAIGNWSQALGYKSISNGNYSTSIGNSSIAKNENAFAFGVNAIAKGVTSFSFGDHTQSIGNSSFAIGYYSKAEGEYSIAMGFYATSGYKAFAVGHNTVASGTKSVAIGSSNIASGETSIAIGHAAHSVENSTVAIGRNSNAAGYHSMALGISDDSGAEVTTASGMFSYAMGKFAVASGNYATAIGYRVKSDSYQGYAIGRWNIGGGDAYTWRDVDPLFEIGNGSATNSRKNALTVYKSGDINIGGKTTITGAIELPIITTSASITLNATHHTIIVEASGVTISLPSATSCKGRIYVIKYSNASAGEVYISASSNEKIDGTQTQTITSPWQKMTVQSNGVNWFIIN